MQALRIRHYLLVFRAVAATTVGITSALAATVTGGVLRRTLRTLLGTASCTATMGMLAETSTLRVMGSLLGASGINSVLKLTI